MRGDLPEGPVLRELEEVSVRLARGAGAVLRRYQPGGTRVDYKGVEGRDPVTEADLRVEEYLREEISRELPDHGIVAEEGAATGPRDADFVWAIDPLDGTANFAAGLPFYAVSIGLLYRDVPVVGSLFLPSTFAGDGVLHARAGGGAFVEEEPIKVLSHTDTRFSGLVSLPAGFGRAFALRRERGKALGEPRTMGSIACEMVLVARGVLQLSVFAGPHIWDVAAGAVLIREAGGEVLEWRRGEWRPLQGFSGAIQSKDEGHTEALGRWRVPLLVGAPELVAQVASRARP